MVLCRISSVMRLDRSTSTLSANSDADDARAETLRSELVALLARRIDADGRHETPIPQLRFYRFSHPTEPAVILQEPAVYVVVQGRKRVTVGDETYFYDQNRYLA